jgi:hypothetical protein
MPSIYNTTNNTTDGLNSIVVLDAPDDPQDGYIILWHDNALYSLDFNLAVLIASTLKAFKEHAHASVPYNESLASNTEEAWLAATKAWEADIDAMIFTFETAAKIADQDVLYIPTDEYFTEEKVALRQILTGTGYDIMSWLDCKNYEEGWRLFREKFFNLWI